MRYKAHLAFLALGAMAAMSCGDAESPGTTTEFGDQVTIGNGEARTYVVMDGDSPAEIGISLTEEALEGLPAPTGNPMDSHRHLLPLPANNTTGYQVVELDWNPAGHPPPMVYTVPHFDIHFYTQSAADRASILPTDPEFGTKAANLPPANLQPAGYAADQVPGGNVIAIPLMGVHWVDHSGPEFNGSPFTSTFIYGSWDGEFTFVEPMVSYDYLKTQPDEEINIPVPATFGSGVYHPTGYRVKYDASAKEYRIGLTGLTSNN